MNYLELDYGAIAIDNSIFKAEGYKFQEGLLVQMRQFKDGPVQVLQSDIVHNEAIKHIGQEILKTRSSIDQALRSANKQLKINTETINRARALLVLEGTEDQIAEARLKEYYESTGAVILTSAEYVDLSLLMRMYFSNEPPFETIKDKKNEFPDAIALLALEGWADQNDINIIAVSKDKGWNDFAENSNRIKLVDSLAEALEKFQPHNKVKDIINHIRQAALLDNDNHVLDAIEQAIVDSIDSSDIYVHADSFMFFEWDDVYATYDSHKLICDSDDLVDVLVVSINDEGVVLKVEALVEVEVEASFNFSVRDSIDKDYVGMGGNICSTKESYHTDILLTLSGDFSKDFNSLKIQSVEVLETLQEANFGEVEPDWRGAYD